jgi:hypothetical protein
MLGNNVLAHVPDLHEFVEGFSLLISDEGVVTFEFPHLVNLIQLNQFDTIYHEHYSYLSLMSLVPIFEKYGLHIFNAEKLSTHGGSLRIYVAKKNSQWGTSKAVKDILNEESQLDPSHFYCSDQELDAPADSSIPIIANVIVDYFCGIQHAEEHASRIGN